MNITEIQKKLYNRKNIRNIILFGLLKKMVWLILIVATSALAQKENKHIRQGNDNYYENNFKDAEVDYMRALEKNPESVKGQYNLGGALYKQDNYEDASKLFTSIAGRNIADNEKANAFYNLGNSLVKAQKFPEAIESYKNSLRLSPDDMDTKYNLEYAKKMMQQQEQEQEQQQDQDKDQENKDEENKDQEKQEQEKEQQEKEQEQQEQQQQNQQNQQQQQQDQPQQISKQDAERMLEALKNDENKTLEKVKLQQVPAKSKKTEKDW